MAATPQWAKALQIPKAMLDEWLTVAPIEESFTFWCLFTGRLPLENYFRWAKEMYGLAYLETGYFQQRPNQELWKQIKSVANWSPWMLPIEQWDGVVFIACVEPPTDMQWSFPVSFVLADPNQLEQHWQRLHVPSEGGATATATFIQTTSVTQTEIAPPAPPPAPPPIVIVPETMNPFATLPENFTATGIIKPEATLTKIDPLNMPLGLAKPESAPSNDGTPQGLNLSGLKLADMNQPPPPPLAMASPIPLKLDSLAPASPFKLEIPEAMAAPKAAPYVAPAPVTPPVAAARPATTAKTGEVTLKADLHAGPINIAQAPDQIEAATTDDACVAWFFKQLRSRYTTGVVLLYNKNSLLTWKWETTLSPKSTPAPVTFDTPSLFRIAARTLRSYHGYVVENPVHQSFFHSWGYGKPPMHVSAVPMILNGTFRGLFLCLANEPMGADALEFIEKVGDKTVMQLDKVDGVLNKRKVA